MKESNVEGLAAHSGPESCVAAREGRGEALTGVRAGRVLSRKSNFLRGADAVGEGGRPHSAHRYREMRRGPARSETRACTETPRARTGRSRVRPQRMALRAVSESPRTHADDARTWEVGQARSTCEVPEQRERPATQHASCGSEPRGGDGGKGPGQRESAVATQVPDTVPGNGDEHGQP